MKKLYSLILVSAFVGYTMGQKTVLETFENSAETPEWINAHQDAPQPEIVANPDKSDLNPSDSVMLWIKAKDAPVWSAAMSELQAYDIQFSGDAVYIHVKMMKDNTDPCALQVIRTDDGISESGKYEDPPTRVPCPTPNVWVDYVFDFSDTAATNHDWSRFYFMAVMNATEEGGWTADPLDNDVNVYFDDIIIDSEMDPYEPAATTVFRDRSGKISYYLNNPVTDELILKGIGKVDEITIYSINGRVVKRLNTAKQDFYRVPVGDLSKGIYLVKIQKFDGQVEVSKIIKQ